MEYKRFGDTIVQRLDKGEEILEQLKAVSVKEGVRLAAVTGLGAVSDFTCGVFNTQTKEFKGNRFTGVYEIVYLGGTVSTMDNGYYAHLHLAAGDENGSVFGGHLSEAYISATAEIVITVIEGRVDRSYSEEIGLNLFDFEK